MLGCSLPAFSKESQVFFCDVCAVRNNWPLSLTRSYGPCEVCGKSERCNDVPSSRLPEVKQPVTTLRCDEYEEKEN